MILMTLCRRMEEAVSRLEHDTLAERIAVGFDVPTYPTGNFYLGYFKFSQLKQPNFNRYKLRAGCFFSDYAGCVGADPDESLSQMRRPMGLTDGQTTASTDIKQLNGLS